jgi:hypothetical protein
MPTPSPIFASGERPLTTAAEAEVDGEATLVLDGIVETGEDRKILVGTWDVKETVTVVAASRIDRSELCQKIGIPSPSITSAEERVVFATINPGLEYGTT